MKRDAESKKAFDVEQYWDAKGEIALYAKNYAGAVEYLARRDSVASAAIGSRALAEAYLWSGDKSRAIDILEKNQMKYDQNRVFDGAYSVKGYYLLGCAYDEIGARNKARAALEQFLTIWKDADPGIKEVEDTKARLTRLKAKS
ncbi:MAG: hypothetical protein NT002_13170 [candidate division Zixibacteria bacterium]|nr:hypothetical protein [candidate division Zixibacteria bacterium]